ncbi:MAG: hypothetical protein AAF721_13905 [Myxococcota bacterium]
MHLARDASNGWLGLFVVVALAVGCATPLPAVSEGGSESSESGQTGAVDGDDSGSTGATGPFDPECGNGIVEAGEACDDRGESASCNLDCTAVVCGDEVINQTAGEVCDGSMLGAQTCQDEGFDVGELSCSVECTYETSQCFVLPDAPVLQLDLAAIKRFDFSWRPAARATHYQLEERVTPEGAFAQLGDDLGEAGVSYEMPLHLRAGASYRLRACNGGGCTESAVVDVASSLSEATGYFKAFNTDTGDRFATSVAVSADGTTLAVGAPNEESNATGIDGSLTDNSEDNAGAVYVYARDGLGAWSQQAYVKASNTDELDSFGISVALSGDGTTLAVGAQGEDSGATGIDGSQNDDSVAASGAVYVFERDGMGAWSQSDYIKASNTDFGDLFGVTVSLSGDGNGLAVGAYGEASGAAGIDGDEADNSLDGAGAVYLFDRDAEGVWSQSAYVKASNPGLGDEFGAALALSGDGATVVVGARHEDSNATGIDGNEADDSFNRAGAAYVFVRDRDSMTWSQQAYVKPSNTDEEDRFGDQVAVSFDGDTVAVGAFREDSQATGVGGNEADNTLASAGAAYVFGRSDEGVWSQVAYVKASTPDQIDSFGASVALSGDGRVLAVGANDEDSNAMGIDGDDEDDSVFRAGAVYVFERADDGVWSPRSYVKASNTGVDDAFGIAVCLDETGESLAVGAYWESSDSTGVGSPQDNDNASQAGAVYLY